MGTASRPAVGPALAGVSLSIAGRKVLTATAQERARGHRLGLQVLISSHRASSSSTGGSVPSMRAQQAAIPVIGFLRNTPLKSRHSAVLDSDLLIVPTGKPC